MKENFQNFCLLIDYIARIQQKLVLRVPLNTLQHLQNHDLLKRFWRAEYAGTHTDCSEPHTEQFHAICSYRVVQKRFEICL